MSEAVTAYKAKVNALNSKLSDYRKRGGEDYKKFVDTLSSVGVSVSPKGVVFPKEWYDQDFPQM